MDWMTYLPVPVAGLVSAFIGWVWYHPRVFGTAWARMSGISPEMQEKARKRMPLYAFIAFLASMVIAYVMSFMAPMLVLSDAIGAVELGFWIWAGFVAPVMLGTVLWEQKSFKLYLINALYWLVAFIIIALVIIYLPQFLPSTTEASIAGY